MGIYMSLLSCIPWFNKPTPPAPPKDHWEGCDDGFYVHDYRQRLDELAKEIHGGHGPVIYTRFNPETKSAELLTDRYGLLATVSVHGSECCPYKAVIAVKDPVYQEHFKRIFGLLTLEFKELA